MTNLKKIDGKKIDAKETIEDFLNRADQFDAVMLVALNKDGTTYAINSTMTHYEKCFLKVFMDSCVLQWFEQNIHQPYTPKKD